MTQLKQEVAQHMLVSTRQAGCLENFKELQALWAPEVLWIPEGHRAAGAQKNHPT